MNLWGKRLQHDTSFVTPQWFKNLLQINPLLTLLTVQPVLWEDEDEDAAAGWKQGSEWTHCGGGALPVSEESHWACPRSEGRKVPTRLWAEFFVCFERECGTWQQHPSLGKIKKHVRGHWRDLDRCWYFTLWCQYSWVGNSAFIWIATLKFRDCTLHGGEASCVVLVNVGLWNWIFPFRTTN